MILFLTFFASKTKKIKKIKQNDWKWGHLLTTVCALSFCTGSSIFAENNAEVSSFLQLREERIARQAAEDRVLEVNAELIQTRKEAERLRTQLADTILVTKSLRRQLSELRFQAIEILMEPGETDSAKIVARLSALVERLQKTNLAVAAKLQEFKSKVTLTLDLAGIKPGTARRQILVAELEQIAHLLRRGTETGIKNPQAFAKRVQILKINDELSVVILDRGSQDGLYPGMTGTIKLSHHGTVNLKIIEIRPEISAAIVTDGRLRYLSPGMEVAITRKTRIKKP